MRAMITGVSGFIGGFLSRHCRDVGCSVLGIDHREPGDGLSGASFELCDVRDSKHLSDLVAKFRPQRIFHMAAQSYPTVSLLHPRETVDVNVGGTVNLFEALRSCGLMAMVVVACSSAEYGPVASCDTPVKENHSLSPLHPYGVSKVAQDLLAAQYFANYSIPTVRIRIFNTTGPGKIGDVCSDLTKRAVEIELGMRPPTLTVGNLTNRRAIADVRDFVRALWLSADHCVPGEVYNIGADQTYSVQEIIEIIRTHSRTTFQLQQDPALLRACDEPIIAGDISKFRKCCVWAPEVSLKTTVADMLDWWRARLSATRTTAKLEIQ